MNNRLLDILISLHEDIEDYGYTVPDNLYVHIADFYIFQLLESSQHEETVKQNQKMCVFTLKDKLLERMMNNLQSELSSEIRGKHLLHAMNLMQQGDCNLIVQLFLNHKYFSGIGFGGRRWAKLAQATAALFHSKTVVDMNRTIDTLVHLQHNNNLGIFKKEKHSDYYEEEDDSLTGGVTKFLNLKASKKSSLELLMPYASSGLKRFAQTVLGRVIDTKPITKNLRLKIGIREVPVSKNKDKARLFTLVDKYHLKLLGPVRRKEYDYNKRIIFINYYTIYFDPRYAKYIEQCEDEIHKLFGERLEDFDREY